MDFNTFVASNRVAFDQLHEAIGKTLNAYTHEERMKIGLLTVLADKGIPSGHDQGSGATRQAA